MTDTPMFQKATKKQAKARVAICGPSGGGKTFTALVFAEALAAHEGGRIAVIDTEKASASLYADRFDFDTLDFQPPYGPERYVQMMRAAADAGYSVVVVDSLSHGWFAEGGVLDIVDSAGAKMGGNRFAGWSVGTPAQNALIATIVGLPIHVVATMRSKQEWILEDDGKGGQRPRRVGMAPQQRDGVEYEFTIVADMDLDHKMVVSKSRVDSLADRVVVKPGPDFAGELIEWLDQGEPLVKADTWDEIGARGKALPPEQADAFKTWYRARNYQRSTLTEAAARDEILPMLDSLESDAGSAAAEEPSDGPQGDDDASPAPDTAETPPEAATEPPGASGGDPGVPVPSDLCLHCEKELDDESSLVSIPDGGVHADCWDEYADTIEAAS